jgi:hypothetical protein
MSFRNILDKIGDLLDGKDEKEQQDQYNGRDVLPASQDPLGDPADQEEGYTNTGYNDSRFGNVRPASEDPLGDPADQEEGFNNVRPASEDPLGDPADQEYRR